MGEVWLARHRMLARPAAVKLIRAHHLGAVGEDIGRTVLKRFGQEAQATAALRSPHTIEVYDFGLSEDGHILLRPWSCSTGWTSTRW